MVFEETNHKVNPLITVISPSKEKALKILLSTDNTHIFDNYFFWQSGSI